MRRILSVFVGILLILFGHSLGYSWDTYNAHPQIVYDALNYLKDHGILPEAEVLKIMGDLRQGVVREDGYFPDFTTAWFHFLGDGIYYPYNLDVLLTVASCDAIQWGFERIQCEANIVGIPQTSTNLYNWQDAINPLNPQKVVALGQVLHLLSDMAVPNHTRNDAHWSLLFKQPDPSLFEEYAEAHLSDRRLPSTWPTSSLKHFNQPQDYLRDLANFTRTHFFSDDTIFHSPIPIYWEDPNYFYTMVEVAPGMSIDRRIAHKTFRYRYVTRNLDHCILDDYVLRDEFDTLYPWAVWYVASLIKHYYDQLPPPSTPSPYDTFDSPDIDPNKWEYLERIREIRSGKLFLGITVPDDQTGSNSLPFVNPDPINSIQADVTLHSLKIENTYAHARLIGGFYNDGTTPGGGEAGDIYAEIRLGGGYGSQPYASIAVGKCNDPDCTSYTNFTYQNLGNIIPGVPYKLSISWNGSFFTFFFGSIIRTFDPRPYAPVAAPPKSNFKGLNVMKFTRIGGIISSEGKGSISATFDNVYANGVLYENFNSDHIDPNKWSNLEFVREIQNGKLISKLRLIGLTGSNYLSFPDPNSIKSIKTDVVVHSFETQDANTRARLSGRFYNDGTPGGGDVVAEIWVGGNSPTPELEYGVGRCNDRDCRSFTNFQYGSFGTASLGQIYTLFLGWDGSIFTFKVNDMTRIIDPRPYAPVVYNTPQVPFKSIETRKTTRVGGTITYGGSGSIHATFDNVYVSY